MSEVGCCRPPAPGNKEEAPPCVKPRPLDMSGAELAACNPVRRLEEPTPRPADVCVIPLKRGFESREGVNKKLFGRVIDVPDVLDSLADVFDVLDALDDGGS